MCRKRIITRILAITLLVIACPFLGRGVCYAALAVEPESIEIVASSDKETTGLYNVTNESDEAVRVTVQPEGWPKSVATKDSISIEKWLSIEPMEFDLAPHERKEVHFAINSPGGQIAELSTMVFFATSAPEGAMTITTRNGVSLYAAFSENMQLKCVIDKVSLARFDQKADSGVVDRGIVFTINIENKGNVHLRPTGSIAITGQNGFNQDLNIERGFPTYVGGKEKYQVLWDKKDIIPGKYEALVVLDYGKIYKKDNKVESKISFAVKNDGNISF